MKVNDSNAAQTAGLTSSGVGKAAETESGGRTRGKGSQTGGASTDAISLSSLGGQVRAASADSPERAAHLDKLSAAFDSGNYKPDLQKVSKAIINDAEVKG